MTRLDAFARFNAEVLKRMHTPPGAQPAREIERDDTAEQCDRCGGDVAKCGHGQIIDGGK